MQLSEYNGWENKFTWLVHLHLSNEEHLMNEITDLVAHEPNEGPASRLVEMWVKSALDSWLTHFPGRNKQHDESLLLYQIRMNTIQLTKATALRSPLGIYSN